MTSLRLYLAILLAIVAGIWVLSLLVGDRDEVGRVVWLVVGVLIGSLWALRSRLPVLGAPDFSIAAFGWLGLILAGVIAVAVAPTSLTGAPPRGTTSAEARERTPTVALKPALPTAERRTGTLVPTPGPTPARPTPAPPVARAGPGAAPSPSPVAATGAPEFDARSYLNRGNAFDCADFRSQAEAQAVLRADPTDPNVIDRDRDGVACEDLPAPTDTQRVPRPPAP